MRQDVEDSISYCFDLQQIQPLPKAPVQEAYYLRQIGFYNFCIVDLKELKPQFYCWSEEQAGKGSTEISSALLHFLLNTDFQSHTILRLFSDGCISQNKNNIVIRTIMYYLQTTRTSIKEIHMHFPTRGHSFLPADRVFGRAEKLLRNKPTIIAKEEYIEIFKELGQLYSLGQDWELKDTKDLKKFYKDLKNISNMKRIFFKVSEVNGKRSLPNEKKMDVNKLLQSVFGNWQEIEDIRLNWYKEVLFNTPTTIQETIDDNENECDCLNNEICMRI
ncbi:unnamed protein product [Parnassius apollo]|uniref:(apollo) hypothetical protein n=1 Tax=Parnassius apollo TaxID=110799 RepID=A0A8S3XC34_PARAO|nr:unnamed protein product [Parnassius apollo]